MVAMWMKKSRQVEAAWWAGWTSSLGVDSCGVSGEWVISGWGGAGSFSGIV
jgi:hypothetical protein